ncbi:hypothetical protein GCM10010172_07230 [Paractinoplanes ferrugineus]|uniref:Uncharacterized protein n=1 Tax=Paractinoplanes ferrugineus TaxID=113564 RepID=A0A919JBX4_9ACTN|nr:hypothetical protein [Actinoplanes ferrugineus]GIE16798.1 hypothetical protein Afe05nite_86380 [Actinoplanes ferrugineus]
MARFVDPWTLPSDLSVGDRAVNPGGLEVEWNGRRGIPVCGPCDLAMTEYDACGGHQCPRCGAVFGESLEVLSCLD